MLKCGLKRKAYISKQRLSPSRSVRRKRRRSLTLKSVRSETARRHSRPATAIIRVKKEIDLRSQDWRAKKKVGPGGADLAHELAVRREDLDDVRPLVCDVDRPVGADGDGLREAEHALAAAADL